MLYRYPWWACARVVGNSVPDPLKDPKNATHKMTPITTLRNQGIIKGFRFLDPLGGLTLNPDRTSSWGMVGDLPNIRGPFFRVSGVRV